MIRVILLEILAAMSRWLLRHREKTDTHAHTHFLIFLKARTSLLTYMDKFKPLTPSLALCECFVELCEGIIPPCSLLLCSETFR